jgi:hypothetical protein
MSDPVAPTNGDQPVPEPPSSPAPAESAPKPRGGIKSDYQLRQEAAEAFERAQTPEAKEPVLSPTPKAPGRGPAPTREEVKGALREVGVEVADAALDDKGTQDRIFAGLKKKASALAEREARLAAREQAKAAPAGGIETLRAKAAEDPLAVLEELGLTPTELSRRMLALGAPEDKVARLEKRLEAFERAEQERAERARQETERAEQEQALRAGQAKTLESLAACGRDEIETLAEADPVYLLANLETVGQIVMRELGLSQTSSRNLDSEDRDHLKTLILDRLEDSLASRNAKIRARVAKKGASVAASDLKATERQRLPQSRGQSVNSRLASEPSTPRPQGKILSERELQAEVERMLSSSLPYAIRTSLP